MRASAVAAAPSTTPAPVRSFQPVPTVCRAERTSTSATCSDASRGSTCQVVRDPGHQRGREAGALRVGEARTSLGEQPRARERVIPHGRGGRRQDREHAQLAAARAGTRRREAHVVVVVGERRAAPARARGGDREADAAPSTRAAEHRGGELKRVPALSVVARRRHGEHVVVEGRRERAQLAEGVARAGEAQIDHRSAASDRHLDAADERADREDAVARGPDRDDPGGAGHALAADPVAVHGRDESGDEGSMPRSVRDGPASGQEVVGARDPARELRVSHVDSGVHDGDGAPGAAAAGRRERGSRADLVVGPGVLDARAPGRDVHRVERIRGHPQPPIALHVGHPWVRAQSVHQPAPGRSGGREDAAEPKDLGMGAEAVELRGKSAHVAVPAGAHQHPDRTGGQRDRAQAAGGGREGPACLGQRQLLRSARGGSGIEPGCLPDGVVVDHVSPRLRGTGADGEGGEGRADRALRTPTMVGTAARVRPGAPRDQHRAGRPPNLRDRLRAGVRLLRPHDGAPPRRRSASRWTGCTRWSSPP